jgi:hypothetical protein
MSEEYIDVEDSNPLDNVVDMPNHEALEVAFDMATIGHMLSNIYAQNCEILEWKQTIEKEIDKFQTAMSEGGILGMMRMMK